MRQERDKYMLSCLGRALAVVLLSQTISLAPAMSEVPVCTSATTPGVECAPIVDTTLDLNNVDTSINNDVSTAIPVCPVVAAPLDNIKLEINNRMNTGLITGQLTNQEMDEVTVALDKLGHEEAQFKLAYGPCLPEPAVSNLLRKYHMINERLTTLLTNMDFVEYMPSFVLQRGELQRRIQYQLAAGNLTPIETEQLFGALSAISDNYTSAVATGGSMSATELEALLGDLYALRRKLEERSNGTIALVAPATHFKLAQYKCTIESAVAANILSAQESADLWNEYNDLLRQQDSLASDVGARAPDLQVLANHIDDLNFILTRELHDRALAAGRNARM